MANQQHLDLLQQGVDIWNTWRKAHPHIQPDLSEAHLEGVRLEGANLKQAHLEEADLSYAHLEGANLRLAFFDSATNLGRVTLGNEKLGFVFLVDVHWGDVNLSLLDWSTVTMLGEEREALQRNVSKGKQAKQVREAEKKARLDHYRWAVRANRQLAVVLRDQGLNREVILAFKVS
jgi:hypothetical protein